MLPDLYDRCVLDAPCRRHRETLYGALAVHLGLIQRVIPAGRAWIDGSFVTRTEFPPEDVDVVIHPADWEAAASMSTSAKAQLYALLTLQDVAARLPPIDVSRLQPVGGVIDAYLCYPGHEATWQYQWSRVLNADRSVAKDQEKGYVEVVW
jgi:hypothetical protein